ncbi:MAG: UxaA family hydrolase [Verrucomicrobiales bacterium]
MNHSSCSAASVFSFEQVARLPEESDNAAIALRTLPAGSKLLLNGKVVSLIHTVLEGHRFAVQTIWEGEPLLSWGLPFGLALRAISPGEYLCNDKILRALAQRSISFDLPDRPNFKDHRQVALVKEETFRPGMQMRLRHEPKLFQGFRRNAHRGSGTRNYIIILGTSSRSGPFCRKLAESLQYLKTDAGYLHGIVAVAHTEGGGLTKPNNYERTLRTLAGFMTNPNVGAVLAVDSGGEPVNNKVLSKYLSEHNYPMEGLFYHFHSIGSDTDKAFAECSRIVEAWAPSVAAMKPESRPLSELKLGLQCGGSDAFSGISANPLLGIMARETIAHGGSASLAETSELIGAESYVLQNVCDFRTAQRFLQTINRFQEWAGWHGHSAEGNPSGGNMFRGLYNIAIKSIGAARKKDAQVRLDYVIEYGDLMPEPGFYFMDSPGNDLESIAGQVASGCNMILFATGNGSITNFPFVPTIKIMTTTARFELVRREMDINAGRYLDGEPLEQLGHEAFEQMLQIASGKLSAGELAGHSQAQLWREWRQTGTSTSKLKSELLPGVPIQPTSSAGASSLPQVLPQIGLILPTSLCSGEIARMMASELNKKAEADNPSGLRYTALAHTEGCGNSAGDSEALFVRTMVGYVDHPLVCRTLLLEHGCEKTHNDAYQLALKEQGVSLENLGWASVQMDGGIAAVSRKVVSWFQQAAPVHLTKITPLRVGVLAFELIPPNIKNAFCQVMEELLKVGASVIVPEACLPCFKLPTGAQSGVIGPTISYGQRISQEGLHVMECPSVDFLEITTGVGGCGATVMISLSSGEIYPAHPIVPMAQATFQMVAPASREFDLALDSEQSEAALVSDIMDIIKKTFTGEFVPKTVSKDITAFQITRGINGISL